MQVEEIFQIPQYSLNKEKKDSLLLNFLDKLTKHHKNESEAYSRILSVLYPNQTSYSSLTEIPYLPVNLFKYHDILSIPRDKVFKTLTSSGTTGSLPSKVFLDRATAQRQTKALANIMTAHLGKDRLPMLIIDHPGIIKDRKSFSARGAGILGMMNFGRHHLYVLNENMELNKEALIEWVEKHGDGPVLLFGFTFMVWKYFIQPLVKENIRIPQGILIHSGGWKKLQDAAVSNEKFKEMLTKNTGIPRCHGFYGMVEQVGSVFVECKAGYLHPPNFADVIIRDPKNWEEVQTGQEGVIQVVSILPTSYPGHSLLTEDLGIINGCDTCSCGLKGKFFTINGRVPKTELRGCSNTFEEN